MYIWVFPKIGVGPQNGWFIMENSIKHGMIWGAHPYFWKQPYVYMIMYYDQGTNPPWRPSP